MFEKPVVGSLMRAMRHIQVDVEAGAGAYRAAVDGLRNGELTGVFPEAGVSASFSVRGLKTGAVRLAAERWVPIIPVAVWVGHRLRTKNRKIRFEERFVMPISFAITVTQAQDVRHATSILRDELQEPGRPAPTQLSGRRHRPVVAASRPRRNCTDSNRRDRSRCRMRPATSSRRRLGTWVSSQLRCSFLE